MSCSSRRFERAYWSLGCKMYMPHRPREQSTMHTVASTARKGRLRNARCSRLGTPTGTGHPVDAAWQHRKKGSWHLQQRRSCCNLSGNLHSCRSYHGTFAVDSSASSCRSAERGGSSRVCKRDRSCHLVRK
eukprot:6411360-Prymnesium_polylepis.1